MGGEASRAANAFHRASGSAPATRFDVLADEILAEPVVDDIGAVSLVEPEALFRLFSRGERELLQPGDRLFLRPLTVEIGARRVDRRVAERLVQLVDAVAHLGERRVDSYDRVQAIAFPLPARIAGKHEAKAEIRGALGDQGLRRVQRIDRVLDPASLPDQFLLEQRVQRMVSRITLVTHELCSLARIERQADVDLDQVLVIALEPVVGAPWLVSHQLETEVLAVRHRDVPQCRAPADLEGGVDDAPIRSRGTMNFFLNASMRSGSWPAAGHHGIELSMNGPIEVVVVTRRGDAIDAPRFLVEGHLLCRAGSRDGRESRPAARPGPGDAARTGRPAPQASRAHRPGRARRHRDPRAIACGLALHRATAAGHSRRPPCWRRARRWPARAGRTARRGRRAQCWLRQAMLEPARLAATSKRTPGTAGNV